MMKCFRIIARGAVTLLIALSSCQNKESEKGKDPLEESYKLIDRGSYSEAIDLLIGLEKNDKRSQVRVALGSAYAARAGIKVDQYWGFVVGFKAPLMKVKAESVPATGKLESLQRIVQQANGKIDTQQMQALSELSQTIRVWDQYKDRVDAIPVVQGEALKDVHRAINVLALVKTPGGRLYRAILNLILFKTYVTASQDFWTRFNGSMEEAINGSLTSLCKVEFPDLLGWLNPISYHLMETLTDLTVAFPESEKDFVEARNLIQEVYSTAKSAVGELNSKRMCP